MAQGRWQPPSRLLDLSRTQFPRPVRQAWGPKPTESRTHWLLPDVTLGCSSALYGAHDGPLTFDLSGPSAAVRGYFIPAGREDPYGQKKYDTSRAWQWAALTLSLASDGYQR